MTLINTDGMAFIGPGSEWFWTAVSGVVLAVTFIAIYRQLRMQASSRAVEQLETLTRAADSEQMHRCALDILVALRDAKDPADIPSAAAGVVGGAWEKYALLARAGHLDIKLLWRFDSEGPQGWWLLLAPMARKRRLETGDRRILVELEWLAGVMAELDRRAGVPVLTADDLAGHLDYWIAAHEEGVRAARQNRVVFVQSSTDPTAGASMATEAGSHS